MLIAKQLFRILPTLTLALTFASANVVFAQQPGPMPEHAKLKDQEGTWNFVMKAGNDEMKGQSVNKLECGGLWLTSDVRTKMGDAEFHGKGMDGYDPFKKKYVSVWVDSMSPAPVFFEGEYDKEGKVLTLTSSSPLNGVPATWRSVTTLVSKDEHTFEMFIKPQGAAEEMKMLTVTYKRAK